MEIGLNVICIYMRVFLIVWRCLCVRGVCLYSHLHYAKNVNTVQLNNGQCIYLKTNTSILPFIFLIFISHMHTREIK